ncbi:serine hydrolase domain-containing protein [Aquipseudomonas campi]
MPLVLLRCLTVGALCSLFASPLLADTWPAADWQTHLAPSTPAVEALQAYAFPARDDSGRKGVRTDALLVVRDGVVVYEHYAAPTTAQTPHLLWSMSKSLFASVLGVAFAEGHFRLDDAVAKHYAPFSSHPSVKMGHLLNWASGLDWQEDYEYAPLKSSVVAMLYTRGRGDMAAFTASHGLDALPGARFRYSSGDSNVLAAALKQMLGDERYRDYPWTALFEPLGITSAVWEQDASGTFVASSYAYMTARDTARVGLLMQRDGRWGERQVLPPAWVAFNRTPFANYHADPQKPNNAVPGGQWWLNSALPDSAKPWPDAPEQTFAALGHWGQALYVLPEEKLVIVRFADDRDGSYQHNELLKRALAAFAGEQP